MIFQGIIDNLVSSILYGAILAVAANLVKDYYYVGLKSSDKKKAKEEEKKSLFPYKIYRKLPWRHAYRNAQKMSEAMKNGKADELYEPTIIVGIGRGGAIFGSIFSYYMKETPLLALERRYVYDEKGERIGTDCYYPINIPRELLSRVLLVAGEYHSGKTMKRFKERLIEIGAEEIRTCVLYFQTGLKDQVGAPDYYGISNRKDCLMPWQEKEFLRTWKDSDDAKVREFTLKHVDFDSLKRGFFLMRHATTAANADDRFIGCRSTQASLNAEGRLEAKNVGRYLKATVGKLDIIYCSPISRCLQTAEEVQNEAGGEIVEDARLIEADFGNWEGVRRQDIPAEEYAGYVSDQHYKIPGSADSYEMNKERIKSFLEDMVRRPGLQGKNVLVVTHKVVGRMMVQIMEHKETRHFRSIPMENASLRKVEVKQDQLSVQYYIRVADGDAEK